MKALQLFTLFILLFSAQQAEAQTWERLGTRVINYGLDRDVIPLGAQEGFFTKLKVVVRGGSINMHKMIVEYGNGERDEIELRHNFVKGSDSRVIDLNGGNRMIKNITFVYDTKNISPRKAVITIFGRH